VAKRQKDYGTGIPRHEIEALARSLLPTMQAMYEDENIRKEFAEWQAKRAEDNKTKKVRKG
jgi:hypothetical protein